MKLNYCTLFDSGYLTRGLAMYNSLARHTKFFCLYIVAFDDKCESILKSLKLRNVVVISLKELESRELLSVKNERSRGEYCWTCTSSSILYCIEKYGLKNCTYIDADVYFFDDPSKLIRRMGSNSVMITRHNYAKEYDNSVLSGIYCVQFVTFLRNPQGMKVLRWWVKQCLDWCYNRCEDGKFGDQKYLDDWTTRFKGIYVLDDFGGGLAPWNSIDYRVIKKNNKITMVKKETNLSYQLNFYHFHNIRFYEVLGIKMYVTNKSFVYRIGHDVQKHIYWTYFNEIKGVQKMLGSTKYGWEGIVEFIGNFSLSYLIYYWRW